MDGPDSRSLGAMVSVLYDAIQNGTIYLPVMECLREARPLVRGSAFQ